MEQPFHNGASAATRSALGTIGGSLAARNDVLSAKHGSTQSDYRTLRAGAGPAAANQASQVRPQKVPRVNLDGLDGAGLPPTRGIDEEEAGQSGAHAVTEDSIAGDDDPLSAKTLRRSQGRLATGLRQPADPSELAIGQKMRSDQQTMKIQIMHQQSPVPEQSAETIDSLRLTAHRQSSVSQYDPQKLGYGPMYALPEREKSTNLPSAQKTIDNAIMRIASGKRITEVSSQMQ